MKILVTVKRVIDPYAKVKPLQDGSAIDLAGLKFDINPFDEIALEEAVRIKEHLSATEIIVVSIGGNENEDQLRKALAMGADKAILIESPHHLDSPAVALELSELVQEIQPDLILMGKQATDDDNNQACQMLAGLLNYPQATFASKINIQNQSIQVTRETDQGEEILELSLPCIISSDLRLNEPRYIALPAIIKARSKSLEKRPLKYNFEPKTRIIKVEAPPKRAAGYKVSSVSDLVNVLREKGVF